MMAIRFVIHRRKEEKKNWRKEGLEKCQGEPFYPGQEVTAVRVFGRGR